MMRNRNLLNDSGCPAVPGRNSAASRLIVAWPEMFYAREVAPPFRPDPPLCIDYHDRSPGCGWSRRNTLAIAVCLPANGKALAAPPCRSRLAGPSWGPLEERSIRPIVDVVRSPVDSSGPTRWQRHEVARPNTTALKFEPPLRDACATPPDRSSKQAACSTMRPGE